MSLNADVIARMRTGTITLTDAAAIFRSDLPNMTEAQIAQVLGEILGSGPHPLHRLFAPLAREELMRRRAIRTAVIPTR